MVKKTYLFNPNASNSLWSLKMQELETPDPPFEGPIPPNGVHECLGRSLVAPGRCHSLTVCRHDLTHFADLTHPLPYFRDCSCRRRLPHLTPRNPTQLIQLGQQISSTEPTHYTNPTHYSDRIGPIHVPLLVSSPARFVAVERVSGCRWVCRWSDPPPSLVGLPHDHLPERSCDGYSKEMQSRERERETPDSRLSLSSTPSPGIK